MISISNTAQKGLLFILLAGMGLIVLAKKDTPSVNFYGPPVLSKNSHDIILAFDLHGVIFSFSTSLYVKRALHTSHKGSLFLLGLNPFFWRDMYRAYQQTHVIEGVYYLLLEKYPQLADSKEDLIALSNAQVPRQETIDLIGKLKREGFTIALCSNIGQETFIDLKKNHPDVFKDFDIFFVATPENGYISKIHGEFYCNFNTHIKNNNTSQDKQIIFIDDKKKNIMLAAQHGITGVIFKNASQLEAVLQKEGLFKKI